jgi:hypothetical protein
MSSYLITVNERMTLGKVLLEYLKSLSKTTNYVDIAPQKEISIKGIDEAIEDIVNGRTTTYENFEAYKKGMRKILGDV